MAFVLPRPLTEDESRRMADLLHISGELPDFSEARLRELFYGTGTQRSGTRPRTVEVGMVLCRPADGYCANSWRVDGVTGPDARVRRLDAVDEGIGLPVAIAAILHEDGGWVLAEDWTAQVTDGGEAA